jgi:hypothetical protein
MLPQDRFARGGFDFGQRLTRGRKIIIGNIVRNGDRFFGRAAQLDRTPLNIARVATYQRRAPPDQLEQAPHTREARVAVVERWLRHNISAWQCHGHRRVQVAWEQAGCDSQWKSSFYMDEIIASRLDETVIGTEETGEERIVEDRPRECIECLLLERMPDRVPINRNMIKYFKCISINSRFKT